MSKIAIGFFVLSFAVPLSSFGKLAGVGDVPYVLESDSSDFTVDADGRSTLLRDSIIRIVNDQGREAQSVQTLSFNSRAQTLKILEATTLNVDAGQTIKTPVAKSNIEIKEVGEMSQAFDSIKQASISFPKVRVGSRLHLRYEQKNIEVPVKGFWSAGFQIGSDTIEKMSIRIRSKLPLYYEVRDAKNRFAHSKSIKDGWTDLEIHSTVPLMNVVVQEEEPFTMPSKVASIDISSLPDWTNYAKRMLGVHEALLKKPLPPILEKIRNKAASKKSAADRLQTVAASVAQEFRYFGDWRRRHGGFVPRSLAEISESRYRDCRDLALIVTAIYRSLGYKANLAWIYRGELAPPDDMYKLPIDTLFNHAIAHVEAEGQTFWIDATNPVAYVRGVAADIADRPAYVLYADAGRLERVPALKAEDATFASHLSYEINSDESMDASGTLKLGGRNAIGLTARAFYSPVDAVNYEIIRMLSNSGKVTNSMVGDFERGSRIVQDVSIPVKFKLAETGLRTSAGLGYPLFRDDSVSRFLVETTDRISDIYLEPPNSSTSTIDLLNVRRVGRDSLDCDIHTDYIDLSRKVKDIDNGISIIDRVSVKKAIIPNEVLRTDAFSKIQDEARRCFNRSAVIMERR